MKLSSARLGTVLALLLLLPPSGAQALDFVTLPVGTGVASMVVAADGTAWFSAQFSGSVGRVSPSGQVSLFELPTKGAQPLGLALHPDGSAWAADQSGARLGRVAPDGTPTEIPLPKDGGEPTGVAVGKDGTVWFSLTSTSRLGRRTPDGTIREYALPDGSEPVVLKHKPDSFLETDLEERLRALGVSRVVWMGMISWPARM
mgnify:CR=1 FL=1